MRKQKTLWLGLMASLGIAPIVLVCLAVTPFLPAETPDPSTPANKAPAELAAFLGSPLTVVPNPDDVDPKAASPQTTKPNPAENAPTPSAIQNANYHVGVAVAEEEPFAQTAEPAVILIPTVAPPAAAGATIIPVQTASPDGITTIEPPTAGPSVVPMPADGITTIAPPTTAEPSVIPPPPVNPERIVTIEPPTLAAPSAIPQPAGGITTVAPPPTAEPNVIPMPAGSPEGNTAVAPPDGAGFTIIPMRVSTSSGNAASAPPTATAAPVTPVQAGSQPGNIALTAQEKVQPKIEPEVPPKLDVPAPVTPTAPTPTPYQPAFAKFGELATASASQATAQQTTPAENISGQSPLAALGAADLLSKSTNALGVEVQRRSPLVGDPRIDGLHFGQINTYADGGYWFPARVDLDTVVSKLNSDNINNILVIKGPFSVRYGPGFSFLDIESLPTPRSTEGCFEAHGSTSLGYRTNSQGWQGEQSFWGGNSDWGFRLSYDIQAANDYTTGNGTVMPSAYNNQFVNFAYGVDLTRDTSLEIRYLHVQQSNVLFPGLLTDVNELTSDAFTARFVAKDGPFYDRLTFDTWLNSTSFNGDSANPRTRQQIPSLDNIFPTSIPANAGLAGFAPVRLDMTTNGNALTYGAREITTWGASDGFNISFSADLRVFISNYNEFDAFNLGLAPFSGPSNLGIPNARQIDPGLLMDSSIPIGEYLKIKVGTRVDFVTTQFLGFGPNTNEAEYASNVKDAQGDKTYFLFSAFATEEYKLTDHWTAQAGYGYAERPPTTTELYAGGAFLGLIQNGYNSIYGDPDLRKEEVHQLNFGLKAKYETLRLGGDAFYAFMPNYITYNNLGAFTVESVNGSVLGTTPINRLQFVNTNLATMYGFNAYGEYDALPWLTPFATLTFVEGWDQERNEALPGIAPLDSRVGLRFHEPGTNPRIGVEYYARMVATQDLVASSLNEQRTGGFVVHYLRGYWQARQNLLLLAGVENIGNLQYREHLDLRTGSNVPGSDGGVFQPGINFYFGMKVTY